MSASLVGSEMCIRDSVTCALAGALASAERAASPAAAALAPPGLAQFCACLLYTSDAADDM
eukprot:6450981-Alexandrium_andersonii.AAC.1